jgi:[ribosomal protein S18]-alanine N-acetyltransferase
MPPPPIVLEPMTAADVEAVTAIEGAARITEGQLREELGRPWARLWVAKEKAGASGSGEEKREVVAFLIAWHVADELHILNIATRVDRRRRGIGKALMREAVAFAKLNRVRHVLLEVRRSNRVAIALYRALRFFAMGVRARYYPDQEDAVEMVLLLDPSTGDVVAHADEVRLEG